MIFTLRFLRTGRRTDGRRDILNERVASLLLVYYYQYNICIIRSLDGLSFYQKSTEVRANCIGEYHTRNLKYLQSKTLNVNY